MVPRMGKKKRKDGGPKIIVQLLNSHSSREKWAPSASSRQSLQRERIRNGWKRRGRSTHHTFAKRKWPEWHADCQDEGKQRSNRQRKSAVNRAVGAEQIQSPQSENKRKQMGGKDEGRPRESEKRVSATKTNKVDVKESFEERKNTWDEAEVVMEQKRIQKDELSQFFVRYMETLEPPERKVQAISEKKVSKLPQSCHTKGLYVGTSPGQFHESGRLEAKERRIRKEEH